MYQKSLLSKIDNKINAEETEKPQRSPRKEKCKNQKPECIGYPVIRLNADDDNPTPETFHEWCKRVKVTLDNHKNNVDFYIVIRRSSRPIRASIA
jgi:hypothetical protein